jgi:hypothetical protein
MKGKYVIGGGISGLIFSFYNPEYTIISPDIGGQLMHGVYNLAVVHHTPETEKLLIDLNLEVKPGIERIGYYYDGKVHDICPPDKNEMIIKKKMRDWNISSSDDDFVIKDRTLSVPENYISILDTDFYIVIKRLSEKCNVINDYIIEITEDEIIGQNGKYEYLDLVSTIPASVFWRIYKGHESVKKIPVLKSSPVTFVVTNIKPDWYNDEYGLIYISEGFYFSRITKRSIGEYTYEFTGIMPEDVFKSLYNIPIKKYFINKFGRIHTSLENVPPQKNIKFLGRFSEWIHHSKIQNVIKSSLEHK